MRMLLRDTCCAIPCCGQCWCEDVAARYRAADGADGAGVRMLLRDTVLRTVRTVRTERGCCCAIPCCGRCCAIPCCGWCGRCWCEDGAARYRAADSVSVGVRMLLRDTVLL